MDLSVSACARVLASVSQSFVFVAPKVMSCGWDLIVRAAEAVAMALASEGCCFMTEGGKKKNTVQSDSSWKHPCLSAKTTQCDSFRARLHVYVSMNVQKGFVPYQWPPPPHHHLPCLRRPTAETRQPRSKKSTEDTVTPVERVRVNKHSWGRGREIWRKDGTKWEKKRKQGCWGGGHKHQGNKRPLS